MNQESKHSFRSGEDYRDHLPCEVCEPSPALVAADIDVPVARQLISGLTFTDKWGQAHCCICGYRVESYNGVIKCRTNCPSSEFTNSLLAIFGKVK